MTWPTSSSRICASRPRRSTPSTGRSPIAGPRTARASPIDVAEDWRGAKLGERVELQPRLRLHPPAGDRVEEGTVVALVLVRVRIREARDRLVERRTTAQVGADRRRIP